MDLIIWGDSHEQHHELEVPLGDFLICTGDFMMSSQHLSLITDFNDWLGTLPHRWKLVIPGNHERFLALDPALRSLISNATVLIDEEVTIEGLKFYGSPMTPLEGEAFGKSPAADRAEHWKRVPLDVNVLITHGPPFGILDCAPEHSKHVGDPELLARIKQLPALRLHCFGHAHGAYGLLEKHGIVFVNAAVMGMLGGIEHRPVALRMNPAT